MTSNADSIVNKENVDTEMKIQQNEEMLKCFTITKMTDQEIRDNPVQFNPIVVCLIQNFFYFISFCLFCCYCFSIGFYSDID